MGEGDKIHETICVNLFFMNNLAGTNKGGKTKRVNMWSV